MEPTTAVLGKLVAGKSLTAAECRQAVAAMLDGKLDEAPMAAFLTALGQKGETADELEGAVFAVRARMVSLNARAALIGDTPLLDTCGTGGDGASTVNISTGAAIVVAACGLAVVKHGNRAASGRSGSADVLSALGVAINPEPELLLRGLAELKIAFLFAPRFHPGMRHVAAVRGQLPFRTLFNLLGPLCNPANPSYQVVGTPLGPQADVIAEVMARSPYILRAVVVSGADGIDEVTLDGPTVVRLVEAGQVQQLVWEPDDLGLARTSALALKVKGAQESADRIRAALAGEIGAVRDYIVANAAAALWVTGGYPLREAVSRAEAAIDSGAAESLLERWRQMKTAGGHQGAAP
jgi:anthranilate phosphoribosyltransferase